MKIKRLVTILMLCFFSKSMVALTSFDFSGKLQTNSIYNVIQDDLGFLWLNYGTGLAKFDGYSVTPISMPDGHQFLGLIYSIQSGNPGNIFILAGEGLFVYNYINHKIIEVSAELSGEHIVSLQKDKAGNYWVATHHGVFYLDENFKLKQQFDVQIGLSSDRINSIYIDSKNNVWIGTEMGLDVLQYDNGRFNIQHISKGYRSALVYIDKNNKAWHCRNEEIYVADADDVLAKGDVFKNIATNAEAISIIERRNEVWIGTRGSGILKYKTMHNALPEMVENKWISSDNKNEINNTILSLYEDNFSNVWIGTLDGLFLYKKEVKSPFNFVKNDTQNLNTPSHNTISAFYCDDENNMWIATANGINKFSWSGAEQGYDIKRYYDNSSDAFKVRNNKIQAIVEWDEKQFLISTKSTIKFFDKRNGIFLEDKRVNDTLQKYQMKYVRSTFKDETGNIWIAFSEGGIGVLSKKTQSLFPLKYKSSKGSSSDIHRAILRDQSGYVWFSSDDDGLYRVKLGADIHQIDDVKLFSTDLFDNNLITSLFEDYSQNIWIGTVNGLYKYSSENESFVKQTLPFFKSELYVNGIVEDQFNNIWVTSLRGLLRLSDRIESRYYEPNPLSDYSKAMYITGLEIDKTGTIFIGGVNGLIFFKPTDVYSDSYPLKTVISNFYIMNQLYYPNGKQADEDINVVDKIVLSRKDQQFSFEFSALYYPNPMNIKYAYKLEGYDKDWIYTDSYRRYASYSNLPSGKYVFKVQSTSVPGVWNQEVKEIQVKVLPPFWLSWWAFLLYTIVLGGFVFLMYKLAYLGTKVKMEEAHSQSKIHSYINLSYGMKTPLTLLYAPLQHLMKNYDTIAEDDAKSMLRLMGKNVKKLAGIISTMMEYRKTDLSKHTLNLTTVNFIKFVDEFSKSFQWQAKQKEIDLHFNTNIQEIDVVIDPQKMEVILFNLLDNAFRNTPNGGKITIECRLDSVDYKLFVDIIDNGKGIPKEKLEQIFERFQNKSVQSDYLYTEGGIGLSLVKDYIQLHHSQITAKSIPDVETKFSFFIHLGQSHFTDEELKSITKSKDSANFQITETVSHKMAYTDELVFAADAKKEVNTEKANVFFYTQDNDLFNFSRKMLEDDFISKHIEDLNSLIEMARKELPSVILFHISNASDKKAVDVCRKMKEDSIINVLPLVIIYSITDPDEKVKIFEIEADGYIEEPFEMSILNSRINKVIVSRKKIKEHVRKELLINPMDVKITSNDDAFIANMIKIIEENISEVAFVVDDLAEKMNVSRSMLYRKTNQLVNQAPTEFIRSIRLNRAKLLLEQTSYNVTEISEKVGFSDARYFSQSFKKQFGVTPKSYSIQFKNKK